MARKDNKRVQINNRRASFDYEFLETFQAGIVLGYKGLTESLTARIKSDLCKKTGCDSGSIRVIATGGLNSVIKPITDTLESVDKALTLKGLCRIAAVCKLA